MILLLLGCGPPRTPWWEGLQADTPCFDVDLADGLDEQDAGEVHALFACLNRSGHLDPFRPVDRVLDDPAGPGVIGQDVARWTNGMLQAEADPLFLFTTAVQLVASDEQDADAWFDLLLELGWGRPADELRLGITDEGLADGILVPLAPAAQRVATELQEDPTDALGWLGDGIAGSARWIETAAGWQTTQDPRVRPIVDGLIAELGNAVVQTHSPQNDRWAGATGNSVRDVVELLVANDVAQDASPPLASVLDDDGGRARLEAALIQLHADGDLQRLLPQLERLVSVDRSGGSLQPGEDSALRSFVRLVARGNRPLVCTVDLGFFHTDLAFGNLSVGVLELMADLDPQAAQDATGLLADLLGFGFTDFLVTQVADSGACPPLDPELLEDLRAVEAMQAPETRAVFVALVRVLNAARYGDTNQIPALVDLIEVVESHGLTEPLEELVRDVGPTPFARDVVELVPVLAEPQAFGITAGAGQPVDLAGLLDTVRDLMREDRGASGLERLQRVLEPMLEEPGTWVALERVARVAQAPDSRIARLLELAPPLVRADPELRVVRVGRPLLTEPSVRDPLLRLLAHPALVETLVSSIPAEGEDHTPLGYLGQRIVDGTAADLVRTLQVFQSNM